MKSSNYDPKLIYVLTSMIVPEELKNNEQLFNDSNDKFFNDKSRTVGWWSTFEQAEEIILKNTSDIYENEYNLAVIEIIEEGTLGCINHMDSSKWFEWNKTEQKYLPIEKPLCYTNIIGFGMS